MSEQLALPFVAELDRQISSQKEADRLRMKKANTASHLKWVVKHYPPNNEECDIMLSGIRLCRFVSDLECEKCPYSYYDHTLGWAFPTKICLKDYERVTSRKPEYL